MQYTLKALNFDLFNTIYIIDEASMVSNHKKNFMEAGLKFESGRLLTDFSRFCDKRKVIFVGDPVQLPPIDTLFPLALNEEYLQDNFRLKETSAFLSLVMRYPKTSGIYFNTMRIRKTLEMSQKPKYPIIPAKQFPDIEVLPFDYMLIDKYLDTIKKHGYQSAILIAYTNRTCNQLKVLDNKRLFTNYRLPRQGDLCIVGLNNYLYGIENGQHIHINTINYNEERVGLLHFRNLTCHLVTPNGIDSSGEYSGKMVMEYLTREKPGITHEKEFELYKRFFATLDPGLKKNKQYVIEAFSADPYINALRLRYGYSITCHKDQGGECDTPFLILEKSLFAQTKDNPEYLYRWVYTAFTRPIK